MPQAVKADDRHICGAPQSRHSRSRSRFVLAADPATDPCSREYALQVSRNESAVQGPSGARGEHEVRPLPFGARGEPTFSLGVLVAAPECRRRAPARRVSGATRATSSSTSSRRLPVVCNARRIVIRPALRSTSVHWRPSTSPSRKPECETARHDWFQAMSGESSSSARASLRSARPSRRRPFGRRTRAATLRAINSSLTAWASAIRSTSRASVAVRREAALLEPVDDART